MILSLKEAGIRANPYLHGLAVGAFHQQLGPVLGVEFRLVYKM